MRKILAIALLIHALPGCAPEPPPSRVFHLSAWEGEPTVVADSGLYAMPGAVKAVDADRDGDLDIAAVGPDRLMLFEKVEGPGGMFRPHLLDDKGCANGLLVLDVDSDGFPDLVSAGGGPPDGRTQPGVLLGWRNPAAPGGEWTRHVLDPAPANFLHDILAADLDNDGEREIIAPRGAAYLKKDPEFDGIHLYKRKTGEDPWAWRRVALRGPDGPVRPDDFGLSVGDVDGDGFRDIIQFRTIWLNPKGRLEAPWLGREFLRDYYPSNLEAADMNGNGRLDLVFTEGHSHRQGSSRVGIWFSEASREGRVAGRVEILGAVSQDPENLAVGDLDGNGVIDIVTGAMNWRNPPASPSSPSWNDKDGNLVIFAGRRTDRGDCFWVKCDVKSGISALHHLSLADMDGDGKLDVLGECAGALPPPARTVPTVQILFQK